MKEYNKSTLRDRYLIKIDIDNREKMSKTAKKLERDRSVITREINKNKNGGRMWYDPVAAQEKANNSYKS